MRYRIELVEKSHPELSMRKQCKLLGLSRSSVDYQAVDENAEDIRIKRLLDEIYMIDPCLGSWRQRTVLECDHGLKVNRKYPYLLRNLAIDRPECIPFFPEPHRAIAPMPSSNLCQRVSWAPPAPTRYPSSLILAPTK